MNYLNKNLDIKFSARFCNNLHQVCSKQTYLKDKENQMADTEY